MKICIISEPWELPTKYYGGTQRIVSLLCEGLIERGFEINLMAGKGTSYKTNKLIYYKNQSRNLFDRAYRRIDFSIKIGTVCTMTPSIIRLTLRQYCGTSTTIVPMSVLKNFSKLIYSFPDKRYHCFDFN